MLRKIVVFLVYIFNLVVFRVEKNGEENIKEKGAYLICANHRSNWDAPILVSNLKRKVYVMAKAELFKNKFIKWFGRKCCVFPVKRGMKVFVKFIKRWGNIGYISRRNKKWNGEKWKSTKWSGLYGDKNRRSGNPSWNSRRDEAF